MSITKFNTSAPAVAPATSPEGGKSKTMNYVLGAIVVGGLLFLGYKYVYLPAQARKRQNEHTEES